jgi:glycosyltransferase involved in cell wall biosynthesis
VLAPRIYDYALVIPVLNEGERIRAQLLRIRALAPGVDVVVADGGSSDGAVAPEFLAAAGVRALLVKTGPGRLGAQLRMAYAWCPDNGYAGIVTIDGNGKDGIEAIPVFVDRLRDGFAYVQGSRYRPGGRAEHTPLDRVLAGRLLHAPLLSLAGRRWYTDTTNGFRGYSAAYLADPRVAPFRDVFDRYALLFYLTVRAGQLDYRTCEVPVIRRYPPAGQTPTKIAGLRGRLAMLAEVFAVVLGRYAPP